MKKTLFIALLIACIAGVRGNVIVPRAWISEILVDSTGNWYIEMGFYEMMITDIDSIRLVTSSGSSIIAYYEINIAGDYYPFDSLSVITVANLNEPVNIEPGGDFVRLVSYVWGVEVSDEIAFGNYPGSYLDCIYLGESINCWDFYEFGIDSSPTIGFSNEYNEDGFIGHFSGNIIDLDGNPICNGFITINGIFYMTITPDEQGSFARFVVSRRYTFDTIHHYVPPTPYTIYTYTIEPIGFCVRPDSSHYQDIITTSLVIGVQEPEKTTENIVTVAPNPFSERVDFYFNSNNKEELHFSIYSLDGKKILQVSLDEDQNKFEWHPSAEIPSGTYIYRLENQNKILKTGKFIRL